MPTRFDTTENALVTSRAHCWLDAFARVSNKNTNKTFTPVRNKIFLFTRNVLRFTLLTAIIQPIQNIERVFCDRWRALSNDRGVRYCGEGGTRGRGTPPPTSVTAVTLYCEDVSLREHKKDRSRANFEH